MPAHRSDLITGPIDPGSLARLQEQVARASRKLRARAITRPQSHPGVSAHRRRGSGGCRSCAGCCRERTSVGGRITVAHRPPVRPAEWPPIRPAGTASAEGASLRFSLVQRYRGTTCSYRTTCRLQEKSSRMAFCISRCQLSRSAYQSSVVSSAQRPPAHRSR